MSASAPLVCVVLPPREGFGPGRTGAIGLLARRLASAPGFRTIVVGGPQDGPLFPGVPFQPVPPSRWRLGSTSLRYAASVAGVVRGLRPALVEVHNRPEIALFLAARLPSTPVSLILNNDPQDMRQASVVLAGVLFQAANSAKTLPRMPVPTRGTPTEPFRYVDPDED